MPPKALLDRDLIAMLPPPSATSPYNWHPAVHRRFGEELRFYLIRLRDPKHMRVTEQVRNALALANVRFACEYSVFGSWDALVRVWLTSMSESRLLRAFKDGESNVADVRYFRPETVRLLWSGADADLLATDPAANVAIAERMADITAVAENFDDPEPAARDRLIAANLLLPRPSEPPGSIKFYVALTRTGEDVPRDVESRAVLSAVSDTGNATRSSLYSGSGTFADYVIRSVVDTYAQVLEYSATLDEELGHTSLRPMTLLIADQDARESDNINDLWQLSYSDEATLTLLALGSDGPELLGGLLEQQRTALNSFVQLAFELSPGAPSSSPLRAKLSDLIRASVRNDRVALTASLAFLLEFEWLLGTYVMRAWDEVWPQAWMDVLGDAFQANDKTAKYGQEVRHPENWTLGSTVHMAIAAADLDPALNERLAVLNGRFSRDLGDDWKGQLRALLELRNSFAHGRLRRVARIDDFAGDWGPLLRQLMNAAALYYRFDTMIQEGD